MNGEPHSGVADQSRLSPHLAVPLRRTRRAKHWREREHTVRGLRPTTAGGRIGSGFAAQSIVVQDRAEATTLGEQRIAAARELVEVERLIGLLLAVALDFDGDRLHRLARGEGQRAGLGDVVVVGIERFLLCPFVLQFLDKRIEVRPEYRSWPSP